MKFRDYLFFIQMMLWCLTGAAQSQKKLSPKFLQHQARADQRGQVLYSVSVADFNSFLRRYREHVTVLRHDESAEVVHFYARADFATSLMNDANVRFIDIVGQPHAESQNTLRNIAMNRISLAHKTFPGFSGKNFVVSLKEDLFDVLDPDLRNKVFTIPTSSSTVSAHATAMATYIAGKGVTSEKGEGVARDAAVVSSNFINLLPDNPLFFYQYNFFQQNHSYGVGIENYYGNEAVAYDQQVNLNPDFVHVFSAGNIGTTKPSAGAYRNIDWAKLSGNFKQAKNVIVVTAIDTTIQRNALNSRGPAFDGRLKPELTAYGAGGTSDAAALTSGMITLLQEKFLSIGAGRQTPAMIRAALVATADDVGPPGIDFSFGYGNINLNNAMTLAQLDRFERLTLNSDQTQQITIAVPDNVTQLRIATSWIDPPASVNADKALVHDIDTHLEVNDDQVLPWVLNHYPHIDSLNKLAVRKEDHLNNTEYITVDHPPAGNYDLVIHAPALTSAQEVAVAYWLAYDTFGWDYPNESDALEAGQRVTLFWHGRTDDSGSIALQLNDGTWKTMVSSADLSSGHVTVVMPDTFAVAKLQMSVDGEEFISDTFVISPRVRVSVPYRCADDFALSWKPVAGATAYALDGNDYYDLYRIATTADTLYTVNDREEEAVYFSVKPQIGGRSGLPSEIIDYTTQGAGCYINFLDAYRYDDFNNMITLQLSTTFNVSEVNIYRAVNEGEFTLWKTVQVDKQTQFSLLDDELAPGVMSYHVVVTLGDQRTLTSEDVSLMVEEKGKVSLFPNPVSGQYLNVLSEGGGRILHVYDRMGRRVMQLRLEQYLHAIDLKSVTPGLYIYQLEVSGVIADQGRFVRH